MKVITLCRLGLLALAISIIAQPADACSRPKMPAGANQVVPTSGINQGLLDAAVRAQVNYHRCRAGRAKLKSHRGLVKVATRHSGWMARAQRLSHKSSVAGQSSLKPRLKSAGIKIKAGAENIGVVHRYRIDEGKMFFTGAGSACYFRTADGAQIPPHTYATLSRRIVNLWMGSSGHRKNVLNRKVRLVGTGVAFDGRSPNCGKFYLTQNLAG